MRWYNSSKLGSKFPDDPGDEATSLLGLSLILFQWLAELLAVFLLRRHSEGANSLANI